MPPPTRAAKFSSPYPGPDRPLFFLLRPTPLARLGALLGCVLFPLLDHPTQMTLRLLCHVFLCSAKAQTGSYTAFCVRPAPQLNSTGHAQRQQGAAGACCLAQVEGRADQNRIGAQGSKHPNPTHVGAVKGHAGRLTRSPGNATEWRLRVWRLRGQESVGQAAQGAHFLLLISSTHQERIQLRGGQAK